MAAGSARGRRRAPSARSAPARASVVVVSAVALVAVGATVVWGRDHFFSPAGTHGPHGAAKSPAPVAQSPMAEVATGSAPSSPSSPSSSATSASSSGSPAPSATAAPAQLPKATGPGTVSVLHVTSADSDIKVRDVYVYRPAVPAGTVLPVVYLLHGVPGSPSSMISTVQPALDQAFTSGAMAPFEVAAPTGGGTAHDDTEWADAVDGGDMVESYLFQDVIPAVEGPTPRPASQRAIVGFSMGGYGAANLALRHPGEFGQFVSISGYFHVDDPAGMFGGDSKVEAANTPDGMVQKAAGKRVLLLEDQDESDSLIQGEASEFASRLEACSCGVDVNWRIEPGSHTTEFVGDVFPNVVTFLDAGFGAKG